MTEAQRKILLDALDLLIELAEEPRYIPGVTRARLALELLLQVGPEWQEDGE